MQTRIITAPSFLVAIGAPDSVRIPTAMRQPVDFVAYGRKFAIKRISRDTWHLSRDGLTTRSRFGTLDQIAEDVGAVMETGELPCSGERW